MPFRKDVGFQIKLKPHQSGAIQILAYDRDTKQTVRLGFVQGHPQASTKTHGVLFGPADSFVAEKIRTMIHRLLSDIQDLS